MKGCGGVRGIYIYSGTLSRIRSRFLAYMNSRRFAMRRPAALLLALWAGPAACFAPSARGVLSLTGPSLRPAPCPARPAGAACGMVPAHAGSGPSRQQRARAAAVRSCAAASSPPMVGACMHDVMRSHAHTHSCASGGTLKPAASQRQVAGPVLRGIRSVLGRLVVQMAVIAAAVFAFAPMQDAGTGGGPMPKKLCSA